MPLGDLIKNLIRSNALEYREGHIQVLDIPGVMLPAPTYIDFLERVEQNTDENPLELLYETGVRHGEIAVEEVGRKNNTSPRQFVEQAIQTGNVMGLGRIQVERYDCENQLLVTSIQDSPLNDLVEESDILDPEEPIHRFLHGVMHSISREIFDSEIESEEVRCQYFGADKCKIRCDSSDQD